MRADTAAVAALTLMQAVLGDWHHRNLMDRPTIFGLPDVRPA